MDKMNKKKYEQPVSRLLPMELRLMDEISVNNAKNTDSSDKHGYIFSNDDVFSRESGDYWENEEGDE